MKKKLIEVALPLEAINKESAREKSIRHGHPSTLHLWWSRKPLSICRAVIFASLVDDPSSRPDLFPTEAEQTIERERLFSLIAKLVSWENSSSEVLFREATAAIVRSAGPDGIPPVYDPFCGGGSIPLEAQRLGLMSYGSDLNPVAVLITKALIEIPAKFAGSAPCNPNAAGRLDFSWPGATGLADDFRYYSNWMRARAEELLGHHYPSVETGKGQTVVPIAWLWVRTIQCPNPACGATMPLANKFTLGTKKGKAAWAQPIVSVGAKSVSFGIGGPDGTPPSGTVSRKGAKCLCCGNIVKLEFVRAEAFAGRMSSQMIAVAAEGNRRRLYVPVDEQQLTAARLEAPTDAPSTYLPAKALGFRVQAYGFGRHQDLFTRRQLTFMSTLSALVGRAYDQILLDGASPERAAAISTYLAFFVSRMADMNNAFCQWRSDPAKEHVGHLFTRQAISMVWDFAEANPFGPSAGGWDKTAVFISKFLDAHCVRPNVQVGSARQVNAVELEVGSGPVMFSTDPPYYDNIGYSDLSDFFYIWLRSSLLHVTPASFETILVPKEEELVAAAERFGGDRSQAQEFFEQGSLRAFEAMRKAQHPDYPLTVYYAFKQAETDQDDVELGEATASTGWETMLGGLLTAGFQITGTWPSRSELSNRTRSQDSNALASSIVLVCRPRKDDAPSVTRREFLISLKRELPPALRALQQGNIAPVDLAQAAIGPGMAVFSRYSKVLENDGTAMKVRTALQLINQTLDEVLTEQESDFDPDTRFALTWYEQRGFEEGPYGDAETLATARAISVKGLEESGIAVARAGKVRLIARKELPADWDPTADGRLTVWEATQHLIRALEEKGETGAAELAVKLGGLADTARELAYRLYSLCERKGRTEEAIAYNSLVVNWPAIAHRAKELGSGSAEFTLTAG